MKTVFTSKYIIEDSLPVVYVVHDKEGLLGVNSNKSSRDC